MDYFGAFVVQLSVTAVQQRQRSQRKRCREITLRCCVLGRSLIMTAA